MEEMELRYAINMLAVLLKSKTLDILEVLFKSDAFNNCGLASGWFYIYFEILKLKSNS